MLVYTTFPGVSFTTNTPADNSNQSSTSILVNVSSSDANQHSTFTNFYNSLVAWWRMDDVNQTGTGAKVYDYFGRNNGTSYADAKQIDAGKLGKAYNFDGNEDYVDTGSEIIDTNYTSNYTVSAWINPSATTNTYIVGWSDSSDSNGDLIYPIGIRNSNISVIERVGANFDAYVSLQPAQINQWHLVTTVYYGNLTFTIYYDGTPIRSALSDINLGYDGNNYIFRVGASRGVNSYFNGSIDDVMIFNRSLSSAEISALYNAGANQYYNNFTGLAGGSHTFKSYSQDLGGNVNSTETRSVMIDATYSIFSGNLTSIASGLEYNPANNYQFNITIANSNGTAGIEFDGVNYSLSNVSNSFYWNAGNLGVGNSNYYFWSYGSGASHLFNSSQVYSYSIVENNSYSLSLDALPNWNIEYETLANITADNCPSQIACNLYRDGNEINSENAVNVSLAAGIYNYTYNTSGNSNYSASSTSSILTVSKNSSYVLSISGTTPINYGTETDVAGSNCPSQLTCSLDKANGIYCAGIVIFNYSTSGNENYTGSSATFEVTINKIASQTSLVFDKTSPQTYLTEITPTCSVVAGVGTPILTLNEGVISSGIGMVFRAATHSFNCSLAGSQNYTGSSNSSSFVVDKALQVFESSLTTPITYLEASDYNANVSSSGDEDCTFNLYRNNELIDTGKTVSDNSVLGVGVYDYVYNTSGCSNWTSASDTKTLTVNANNGNCNILFNETSPLTYPDSFTVYSDCSSDYILYRNGSIILNGSTQSLAAGIYNFSVIRTDNENYSNTYDEEAFTIGKANIVLTKLLNGDVNNLSITYPQQINATAYSSQGTVNIFRYSIDVTS